MSDIRVRLVVTVDGVLDDTWTSSCPVETIYDMNGARPYFEDAIAKVAAGMIRSMALCEDDVKARFG